jgi:peptidyl-prolyl cis-trans isomerase D
VLPKVYDTPTGPVVAKVKERVRPDAAKFAEKKGEVEMRLRLTRESQIEQAWMKGLKDKAKVELNGALVRGEVTAAPVDVD